MKSKLYISCNSWVSSIAEDNPLIADHQILRWADDNSIESRIDHFFDVMALSMSSHHIDLGAGTGRLVARLLDRSLGFIQAVEFNKIAFERMSRLVGSKRENLILYPSSIQDALPLLSCYGYIRPLSLSLIGVLQNCQCNPFELIDSILVDLTPEYVYLTTKATMSTDAINSFDAEEEGHSLFWLPELLDIFSQHSLFPVHISQPPLQSTMCFNYRILLSRAS